MNAFAFRDTFPKATVEPSWDRDEVAKALRQSRVVSSVVRKSGGNLEEGEGAKATVLGAAKALEEKSKQPAKKFTKKWSDNKDRETLADRLRKKANTK